MNRPSFVSGLLLVSAGLTLLGAGCSLFGSSSTSPTVMIATIPSGFPEDVIQFPYSTTTLAVMTSSTVELVQLTTSSTADLVTWFNRAYPNKQASLHRFHEENGAKIYSFENAQWDYEVTLEPAEHNQTRIKTKRLLITSVPY